MGSPPISQFFCSRPDGTLTALIAVDDLPPRVSIRGVPRTLSPNDTQGMVSLGSLSPRSTPYIIDGFGLDRSSPIDEGNSLASQRLLQQKSTASWASFAGNRGMVPSTGGAPVHKVSNNKKYCSFWIRNGECDYQQQGCIYKHEMPKDIDLLEKLGLRDIPRWYRERYNVPSLLSSGTRPSMVQGQQWRDNQSPDHVVPKKFLYQSHAATAGVVDPTQSEKVVNQKGSNHSMATQRPLIPTSQAAGYAGMDTPMGPMWSHSGFRRNDNYSVMISDDIPPAVDAKYPALQPTNRSVLQAPKSSGKQGNDERSITNQCNTLIDLMRTPTQPAMTGPGRQQCTFNLGMEFSQADPIKPRSRHMYAPRQAVEDPFNLNSLADATPTGSGADSAAPKGDIDLRRTGSNTPSTRGDVASTQSSGRASAVPTPDATPSSKSGSYATAASGTSNGRKLPWSYFDSFTGKIDDVFEQKPAIDGMYGMYGMAPSHFH